MSADPMWLFCEWIGVKWEWSGVAWRLESGSIKQTCPPTPFERLSLPNDMSIDVDGQVPAARFVQHLEPENAKIVRVSKLSTNQG